MSDVEQIDLEEKLLQFFGGEKPRLWFTIIAFFSVFLSLASGLIKGGLVKDYVGTLATVTQVGAFIWLGFRLILYKQKDQ